MILDIIQSFIPTNQVSRVRFGPKPAGGVRTDSDVVCSVSLVRESEGDGWVSELTECRMHFTHGRKDWMMLKSLVANSIRKRYCLDVKYVTI